MGDEHHYNKRGFAVGIGVTKSDTQRKIMRFPHVQIALVDLRVRKEFSQHKNVLEALPDTSPQVRKHRMRLGYV